MDVAAIVFTRWALHFVLTIRQVLIAFVQLVLVWDAFISGRSVGKPLVGIVVVPTYLIRFAETTKKYAHVERRTLSDGAPF